MKQVAIALLVVLLSCGAALVAAQAPSKSQRPRPQKSEPKSDPLEPLMRQAEEAIEKKDYATAVERLKAYLVQRPDDAVAHFQLGYSYSGLQREEEAKAEYSRAIELNPRFAEAYLNLGLTLLDQDPAAAVEPLRRAASLMPGEARPRFLLGVALERTNDLAGAVEQYELAQRMDPKDLEYRLLLGRALLRLNRATEAEGVFREALALPGDGLMARLGLVDSLLVQKKPEQAAEELRTYLQSQPQDRESRMRLATLLVELKKYDQALEELDRAEAGAPPSLGGYKLRAEIYIEQKQFAPAVETVQKALQLAPQDAELHGQLGRLWLEKRDFASADRELRQALQLDPKLNGALRDLVAVYYLSGNYQATLQVLDLLDKREAPGSGSWFVRATCYDKLGRKAEALAAYEKFIDLDQGRNDRNDFQAQQRVRALKRELEQKKR